MLKMSAPCTIIDTKVVEATASAFDQTVPSALQTPEAGTFLAPGIILEELNCPI